MPVQKLEAEDIYAKPIDIDQPITMTMSASDVVDTLCDIAQTQADLRTAIAGIPTGTGGTGGTVCATQPVTHHPDPFNSDKRDYEVFTCIIDEYASFLPDNQDRKSAALSYGSKGATDIWARAYTQSHGADYRANRITWEDFLIAIDQQFRDPQLKERARQAICIIRPGPKENMDDFFIRFNDL